MGTKFSIYDFSDNEIARIAMLLQQLSAGVVNVDGRTMTKQVRQYAVNWGLLEKRSSCYELMTKFTWRDIPVESLWLLVEPMLNGEKSRGRSIATDKRWLELNIWPQGHRFHKDKDIEEIVEVLSKLSSHAYLYVQIAGSVWAVTRRVREVVEVA